MACSQVALQRAVVAGFSVLVLLLMVYLLQHTTPEQMPVAGYQLSVPLARIHIASGWNTHNTTARSILADSTLASWGQTSHDPETDSLKHACDVIAVRNSALEPDVKQVMHWVCQQIGGSVPQQLNVAGCNKSVTYVPTGRLGNLLNLYAVIFSFSKMYGTTSYVDSAMWKTIHRYFPQISLRPTSEVPAANWTNIQYTQAESHLTCRAGESNPKHQYYRIVNYPVRNGIDVFHPFYDQLRKEFRFSESLQRQAREFLRHASANRSSTTFIGFHIRRTDYKNYINTKYNSSLPDEEYFSKSLEYYRSRFADALFIVCSDDMSYVEKTLQRPQQKQLQEKNDIVIAGNRNINEPGRDMALLASCNHSIVTVGTYGFWGAYLAGGTVLVPENQTHLSMGDRHAPKLEIQLAGATNWIAIS